MEDTMTEKNKKVKNNADKMELKRPPIGDEGLEPCGKPQAQEAARLQDADDACDEGLH
jgi:hypothetical protein